MKRKKILICCILAALLTALSIIPIFALSTIEEYFSVEPADLGTAVGNYPTVIQNTIVKNYIKVKNIIGTVNLLYRYYDNNNNVEKYSALASITYTNGTLKVNIVSNNSDYYFYLIPTFEIEWDGVSDIYIPIFCYNCTPYNYVETRNYIDIYNSTETTQTELLNQYYSLGYTSGYNTGFDEGLLEGQNIQQYTNLVGYVEQLIGQFTGSSAAQYITPIAIVLVVLFVYFLFIRFLLSLVKAKGIIKTCDIIMIVACIIMLVVMYAPMLDLTIKTEQINSSEETTETVQVRNSNIYVETTETGDIYYGPVGTVIVTKSETIEDVYKITKDIETEAIAYEKD